MPVLCAILMTHSFLSAISAATPLFPSHLFPSHHCRLQGQLRFSHGRNETVDGLYVLRLRIEIFNLPVTSLTELLICDEVSSTLSITSRPLAALDTVSPAMAQAFCVASSTEMDFSTRSVMSLASLMILITLPSWLKSGL